MTTNELIILSQTYVGYLRRKEAIYHDLESYNIYTEEEDTDLLHGFEKLFELNIPDPSFTFALLDLAYDGSVTLVDGEYTKVEDLVREYCKDRDVVEHMNEVHEDARQE